jgi:hypothetical protein
MKITSLRPGTGPDLHGKLGAPSATRTRDLLLRRHNRPSAMQTSNDARHQRAKQLKAVALGATFAGSLPHGRGPVDFSRMTANSVGLYDQLIWMRSFCGRQVHIPVVTLVTSLYGSASAYPADYRSGVTSVSEACSGSPQ